MKENDAWIVCKHVMDGSAEKIQIRRQDKVCTCLVCAEDLTILETDEIHVLPKPLLKERLRQISQKIENNK